MNWFWHAIWICVVVIPIGLLWLVSVFDIIVRRHDLTGWKRFGWLLLVLFVPVIGAMIYAVFSATPVFGGAQGDGGGMNYRDLESLRARGELSQGEYERARERIDLTARDRP